MDSPTSLAGSVIGGHWRAVVVLRGATDGGRGVRIWTMAYVGSVIRHLGGVVCGVAMARG